MLHMESPVVECPGMIEFVEGIENVASKRLFGFGIDGQVVGNEKDEVRYAGGPSVAAVASVSHSAEVVQGDIVGTVQALSVRCIPVLVQEVEGG